MFSPKMVITMACWPNKDYACMLSALAITLVTSAVMHGRWWWFHALRQHDRVASAKRTGQGSSQHAKVDLKSLIVSVIPIYSLSDTINLFCFLFFI